MRKLLASLLSAICVAVVVADLDTNIGDFVEEINNGQDLWKVSKISHFF